jgi:hypothetical protein
LATSPIFLWKISKTKHLSFAGRELRYLKLLVRRQDLRLCNSRYLLSHSLESSGTSSHSVYKEIYHQRQNLERERIEQVNPKILAGKQQKCPDFGGPTKSHQNSSIE